MSKDLKRGQLMGALGAASVFLAAYTYCLAKASAHAQFVAGFLMVASGGIFAAFGELSGNEFDGSSGRKSGALLRSLGFVGITLGGLLLAVPDVRHAVANHRFSSWLTHGTDGVVGIATLCLIYRLRRK